MKRIGILTIWKSGNYGAELQAYALQAALNYAGFDAEIIDYPFYKNSDFILTKRGKTSFSIGWKNRAKEWLLPRLKQLQMLMHPQRAAQRNQKFDVFYRLTKHSPTRYLSMDQLYDDKNPVYDIYITGSDQIWNPRTYAAIEPFFLTFAPKDADKIAYAASFGVSALPAATHSHYRTWLQNLDAISVRETDAVELVREIAQREATAVLDPTLLLTPIQWRAVATKTGCNFPYLLLYDVTPSAETVALAKKIAGVMQCRIIRIAPDIAVKKIAGTENLFTAGPAEFLGLIDGATFVVTNSFHGSVFSILFEKPFFTVKPSAANNNGRLFSLLQKLDLLDRLIPADQVPTFHRNIALNYTRQQELLQQERAVSWQFLHRATERVK